VRLIIFKNIRLLRQVYFFFILFFLVCFLGVYYVQGNPVQELECICCING